MTGWQLSDDGYNVRVTLPESLKDTPYRYNLTLRVTAEDNAFIDLPIVLTVRCSSDSVLVATSEYPNGLGQAQETLPGFLNYFSLPVFEAQPAGCAMVKSIEILSASDTNQSSSFLINQANLWTGNTWIVRPYEQAQGNVTYKFKVKVTDSLGFSYNPSTVFTLIV